MLKDTKTIIFLWNDNQALAFTRYLNRMYVPGTATLNGARIEVSQHIPKGRMIDHLFDYHQQGAAFPIAKSDLTYRYRDNVFVDLHVDETTQQDADRVINAIVYQRNHVNGYVPPKDMKFSSLA